MLLRVLRELAGPPLILMAEADAEALISALQAAPDQGVVRVVRGRKCRFSADLHTEVGAALQFPWYYGENFDAMDECITDLSWAPGFWYVIHVTSIQDLLPGDEPGFRTFLEVLVHAHGEWANPGEPHGIKKWAPAPFHTILSGTPEGLARIKGSVPRELFAEA